MVAIQLFYHQLIATGTTQVGSETMVRLAVRADYWNTQAKSMTRGGARPWWYPLSSSIVDEMNYECDAGLGRPSKVDCTQIEWQQLGAPSDSIAVGPEQITFLHSSEFSKLLSHLHEQ